MAKKEEICSFTFLTATKHQYSKRLRAQRQSLPLQLKMFTAAGGRCQRGSRAVAPLPNICTSNILGQLTSGSPYQRPPQQIPAVFEIFLLQEDGERSVHLALESEVSSCQLLWEGAATGTFHG